VRYICANAGKSELEKFCWHLACPADARPRRSRTSLRSATFPSCFFDFVIYRFRGGIRRYLRPETLLGHGCMCRLRYQSAANSTILLPR